jgi:hypothetical protein
MAAAYDASLPDEGGNLVQQRPASSDVSPGLDGERATLS